MEELAQGESIVEIYEESPCGYFSALPDGTIIKINQTLLSWLGYTQDELVGKFLWTNFLTMGGKIYHQTHFVPLLYIQDFLQEINLDFIRKDGERIPVLVNARTKKDHLGKLILIRMSIVQFTQRKLYEQEILISKKKAEMASNAKSEFLSNMSHEIRTPLNAVIGFTDLLLKTNLNETQSRYLGIVNQSANLLLDLLNDILDLSKIEAGKLEINNEKIDIVDLLEQSIEIINFKAESKGLEVILDLPPDLPKNIFGDFVRLRQIIINLLGNSVKFTEKGEIQLKVEVRKRDTEKNKIDLLFSVRDTGIGISDASREKIFESFSQADSSISRKFGGTGLGLSISNKLLDLMNSKLELSSEIGKGSEFSFLLCTKFEDEEITKNKLEKIKRVLVVDDNKSSLEIISKFLEYFGLKSDLAVNEISASELILQNEKYDLIIMDSYLGDQSGIEIIKHFQNVSKIISKDLPIIMMSKSIEDKVFHESCNELNINLKLVKPIKKNTLWDILIKIDIGNKKQGFFESEDNKNNSQNSEDNIVFSQEVKILVVDDDSVNRFLAKTILKQLISKVIVFEAIDGKEAIDVFKREQPAIILMDVQMPILNGYEATSEIRKLESGQKVPIIALTAGILKENHDKYLQAGMSDYLSKPFKKDQLNDKINKWLVPNFIC